MSSMTDNNSAGPEQMETECLEDSHFNSDETLTKSAIELQKKLDQLRQKVVAKKSELTAKNQGLLGAAANNDDRLYGKLDVAEDELHKLTVQRTHTFLNFSSLQMAIRAAQANQALTRALNLERDSTIALEEEEETYVRELLEEQRATAEEIIDKQKKVVDQEMELIDARNRLADEYKRYQDLFEKVGKNRLTGGDEKDEGVKRLKEQQNKEEDKLNQMRFMIQKFMISHPNVGLQFDAETNARYQKIFLGCGSSPEELREEFCDDDSGYVSKESN